MAQLIKVNPAIDGNSYASFGRVPDYVEINFGTQPNLLSAQNLGPSGAWPLVIQTIEQSSTIEVLGALQANLVLLSTGVTIGSGSVGVRMLLTGVNTETNLQAAIQALGTVVVGNATVGFSNVNFSGATVAYTTIGNVQGVAGSQSFYF